MPPCSGVQQTDHQQTTPSGRDGVLVRAFSIFSAKSMMISLELSVWTSQVKILEDVYNNIKGVLLEMLLQFNKHEK